MQGRPVNARQGETTAAQPTNIDQKRLSYINKLNKVQVDEHEYIIFSIDIRLSFNLTLRTIENPQK